MSDKSEINTRPGPTDHGGHGGMATREQEARQPDHEPAEVDLNAPRPTLSTTDPD